jgi:hypothetical protein
VFVLLYQEKKKKKAARKKSIPERVQEDVQTN